MTIHHRHALKALLDRVAEPSERPETYFLFDEVAHWPSGAVSQLMTAGLLEVATRDETVICDGCEERCYRPVTFPDSCDSQPQKAHATCHLFTDRGPFQYALERLNRWSSSRQVVSEFVAQSLGLKFRDVDPRWRRIKFGAFHLDGVGVRQVSLEFNGAAELLIGSVRAPLIDFIVWSEETVSLDQSEVETATAAATDRKSGDKRDQPSTAVRDDRRMMTEIRDRKLQRAMNKLASEHPNLNKNGLAKLIEKSGAFAGMTAARIARVTRMPKKVGRKDFASSPDI